MNIEKVVFISPMFNASSHLEELVSSLKSQNNKNWEHIIIDDMSTDDSYQRALDLTSDDDRFIVLKNDEKKWALKNVVDAARMYQDHDDVVIANLDADDALCNNQTVDIIVQNYNNEDLNAAWTSHRWDINNLNVSKGFPSVPVDPYDYPWVSSHLKTWRASVMKKICNKNFQNLEGEWFIRGYDQALYLPILHIAKKIKHIDEICYLYRINSKSISVRDWNEKIQMDTVRLVRARGFINA